MYAFWYRIRVGRKWFAVVLSYCIYAYDSVVFVALLRLHHSLQGKSLSLTLVQTR